MWEKKERKITREKKNHTEVNSLRENELITWKNSRENELIMTGKKGNT